MRFVAGILFLCGCTPALAQTGGDEARVDLELVLAVDISYSMDLDELRVQREGYISALTSKPVLDAITGGVYGRIALAYVEWAGANRQDLAVDWQIIDSAASAQAFAAKLADIPPSRAYRTSISSALTFSAGLFGKAGFDGVRRVIDVSGDGPNNQGLSVTAARDRVVAANIAINGLPLLLKDSGPMGIEGPDLDAYYRSCVIGGMGAFVVPVTSREQFAEAIRTKLVLEISGTEPPARVIPAQSRRVSCTVGEIMWRERYGDYGSDEP
jgi:hypothetical protein